MSTAPQRRRRSNWIALGVVGGAVVAATLVTTGAFGTTPSPAHSVAAPAVQPSSVAKPSPQPTKTATIKGKVAIKPALAATVTAMTAVQGEAQGPGEIAGPAVRFTIAITNDTGKPFNLANTVVNAYSGAEASPAEQLMSEGTAFPKLLKDGETASAQFVFTIPKDQRSDVLVTVDTAVNNPVVAFRGSAPQ